MGRQSQYTEEFRRDAVALSRAVGGARTHAAVAADLGISGETPRTWVRKDNATGFGQSGVGGRDSVVVPGTVVDGDPYCLSGGPDGGSVDESAEADPGGLVGRRESRPIGRWPLLPSGPGRSSPRGRCARRG